MIRSFLFLAGLTWAAALSAAPLTWDRSSAEVTTSPGQKEAVAELPFRNAASVRVNISSIDTSCGCTTAKSDKSSYGPGESGKVRIVMQVKPQFSGVREVTVNVMTDLPDALPDELVLRVHIPAPVTKG